MAEEGSDETRKNRRDLLRGYYGTAEDMKQRDIYDINEAYFQHGKYLDKMFKERSLHELMDKESEIIKREYTSTIIYYSINKSNIINYSRIIYLLFVFKKI